ncbi:hypothetical protein GE09DRAFT_1217870 [Coniochaeta sp. 2T2.1]|nr:hypothetical protein GE09DRAFT_1217870 [Coniochaeta sp. 2T2.1]
MTSPKAYSAPRRKGPSTTSGRVQKNRRTTAGARAGCCMNQGFSPSRPIPIDPETELGDINPVPCRACALDTGQCHAIIGIDGICWGCRDRSRECEALPQEAIQNGTALTAAMVSGADRFTTGLLTENLRRLLQSLEGDSEDDEPRQVNRNERKRAGKPTYLDMINRAFYGRLDHGDESYVGSDEEVIDDVNNRDDVHENAGVNKEPDEAPAEHLAADVESRRIRLKELVGEIIDLLVR